MSKKTGRIIYLILSAVFLCIIGTVLYVGANKKLVHYYEIQSKDGLRIEDVQLLSNIPAIRNAYAIADKKTDSGESIQVHSINKNAVKLLEGRLPENDREILISRGLDISYKSGDFINLDNEKYKITGIFENNDDPFIICLPAAICDDSFTRIGVETVNNKGLEEILGKYIAERKQNLYDELTAENQDRINQSNDKYSLIKDVSSDELLTGKEKLNSAAELLADGETQIRDYEKQIADGKSELSIYEEKLAQGLEELNSGKTLLDNANREIENARKQLYDELAKNGYSLDDLNLAEQQIQEYEKQITDSEKELRDSQNLLNEGKVQLSNAKRQLDGGKSEIDYARVQLQDTLAQYGLTIDQLVSAMQTMQRYTEKYNISMDELNRLAAEYETYEPYITALNERCKELIALLNIQNENVDSRINAAYKKVQEYFKYVNDTYIHSSLNLTKISIEKIRQESEMIISIFRNAEYFQIIINNKDLLDEALNANDRINAAQRDYDAKYAEYLAGLSSYRDGQTQLKEAREELNAAKKTFKEKKELVTKAIDAKKQIDALQKEYDKEYSRYQNGLEVYNQEKAKYDAAYGDLEDAKKKVDEAKYELDLNRDEYERGKAKYDKASSQIDDELNSINTDIETYEDVINELQVSWNISDCIKTVDEGNAFAKAILVFILACLALLWGYFRYFRLKKFVQNS